MDNIFIFISILFYTIIRLFTMGFQLVCNVQKESLKTGDTSLNLFVLEIVSLSPIQNSTVIKSSENQESSEGVPQTLGDLIKSTKKKEDRKKTEISE